MIGIIYADKNEETKFGVEIETKKLNGHTFKVYKDFVIVHSGIGIANAAACTQELISSFKVNKIFNYGAVGGINPVKLYDIIAPEKITYHDVATPWYKRGQTPNELQYFPNAMKLKLNYNLASGSSFLTDYKTLESISKEIDAFIFDMEGAAIAQIAYKNNVPVFMIKCVSDVIGISDTDLEDTNIRISKAGDIAYKTMMSALQKHI